MKKTIKKKKSILFLISNLAGGGAEKVLTDLVNNLDSKVYDIEVKTIYNEGKYIKELNKNINYTSYVKNPTIWKKRILNRIIKYFPSKLVYKLIVKNKYDYEVAFLESLPAKIISGSRSSSTKFAWVHVDVFGYPDVIKLFGNTKKLIKAYEKFDRIVCVSESVKQSFVDNTKLYQGTLTIYNPIDKDQILKKAKLNCDVEKTSKITFVTIGRLEHQKGFLRLCEVVNKLKDNFNNFELWILGEGTQKDDLENYIRDNDLTNFVKLLGFKDNPYAYLNKADLFISSSFFEGYSLVLAEALVLGIPVLSTNTTGPDNLLEHGKYGCLVDNSFEGLYNGLFEILSDPQNKLKQIKEKGDKRKEFFNLKEKIEEIDELFLYKDVINKDSKLFCTVFTPTYNRGYILEKLYKSLQKQTCTDFEWLVVDDGSSDNTETLFKKWEKEKNKFKINYVKKENGGKQKAINKGIELAKGKMFFIVDSDDSLTDNAIERLKYYESTISSKENYAGISGLRGYDSQNVIGQRNENDYIDITNLERPKHNLTGDKAECYYLDLLKRYRFPEVENEKFITECVVWDKIAYDNYKIRWFNEIIYIGNYLDDGYTKKGNSLFEKNPTGYLINIRNKRKYKDYTIKQLLGNYYGYYEIVKNTKSIKKISEELLISTFTLRAAILMKKVLDFFRRR